MHQAAGAIARADHDASRRVSDSERLLLFPFVQACVVSLESTAPVKPTAPSHPSLLFMSTSKPKSRRKGVPPAPRPALENEDWQTKSMRLIEENFAKHGGAKRKETPEDKAKGEENWKRTQRETTVHEQDPAAAVRRWRELWEQRTPGGDNEELKDLSDQFHYYADVLGEYSHPDNLEEQCIEGQLLRVWKGLCDNGLPEVCTVIAQDDRLFDEKEVSWEVRHRSSVYSCRPWSTAF